MSDYFDYDNLTANAVARASDVNARFLEVSAGFDLLPAPATLGLAIKTLVTAAGTANALTVANSSPILAYATGQRITFIAPLTNTGAVTINVDGVGVVSLTTQNGGALTAGDVAANSIYDAIYTGGSFRLTSLSPTTLITYNNQAIASAAAAAASETSAATDAASADADAASAAASAASATSSASSAATSETNAAASAASVDPANIVHRTGTESIGGLKTFEVDPIIPNEAYGSAWNGSLEPPTKDAVFDKMEGMTPDWTLLSTTTIAGLVANVIQTGLAGYNDLFIVVDGASHNDASTASIRIHYSSDNGATYNATVGSVSGGYSASQTTFFTSGLVTNLPSGAPYGVFAYSTSELTSAVNVGAAVTAIKLQWSAGSFDAGTIKIFGR